MSHCPVCFANLNGRSRCLTCRRNERYEMQGYSIHTPCNGCGVKTKLMLNGDCKKCLQDKNMRICNVCLIPQMADMAFGKKKATCHDCLGGHPPNPEYVQAFIMQKGLCACCGKKSEHTYLQLGGALVCVGCDTGIRCFAGDPMLLRAAADLIETT